jgi:DegV family protein with EDD domain
MSNVCILTDSTVQFTRPNFLGRELVYVIPFDLQPVARQDDNRLTRIASTQRLVPPGPEEFLRYYSQLSREYDSILTLMLSSFLSPATVNAQTAARLYSNHASVQVVDTQTTAAGLGLLVEVAASAASRGASFQEVERRVRAAIHRIYMLFCIPELTYLAGAGHLSYPQALVGEMMGLLPIFALEEGRLTPMEKVRTQRHLLESFQEFMDEFDNPYHVALVRGINHNTIRTRPLRQYVQESFPRTPFSEHSIGPHLAALLGPQSIGLVVMERTD